MGVRLFSRAARIDPSSQWVGGALILGFIVDSILKRFYLVMKKFQPLMMTVRFIPCVSPCLLFFLHLAYMNVCPPQCNAPPLSGLFRVLSFFSKPGLVLCSCYILGRFPFCGPRCLVAPELALVEKCPLRRTSRANTSAEVPSENH